MNKFVSEKEIHENREKFGIQVNGEDEHYDPRPLYEKLQSKKQEEEDAYKDRFKSQPPKAMDEDEYEFLAGQNNVLAQIERKIQREDAKQLEEFSHAQADLGLKEVQNPIPESTEGKEDSTTEIVSVICKSKKTTLKKPQKKANSLLASSIRVIDKKKSSNTNVLSKRDQEAVKKNIMKQDESESSPLSGLLGNY